MTDGPATQPGDKIMTTDMPETDVIDEGNETEGGIGRRTVLRVGAVGGVGLGLATAQGLVVPALQEQGPVVGGRGVLRVRDHDRRPAALHRGVPDQPADPGAVQGRAADPEGAAPPESEYEDWDKPAGTRAGPAELAGQRAAPDVAEPDLGYPDPIVYKIDLQVSTHDFTTSQVLPITTNGKPTVSFDADRQDLRRGHQAHAAAQHDLRVQRHVPGPDDQRRVRQAGAGPVREPSRREPGRTSTGRTSAHRTGRS